MATKKRFTRCTRCGLELDDDREGQQTGACEPCRDEGYLGEAATAPDPIESEPTGPAIDLLAEARRFVQLEREGKESVASLNTIAKRETGLGLNELRTMVAEADAKEAELELEEPEPEDDSGTSPPESEVDELRRPRPYYQTKHEFLNKWFVEHEGGTTTERLDAARRAWRAYVEENNAWLYDEHEDDEDHEDESPYYRARREFISKHYAEHFAEQHNGEYNSAYIEWYKSACEAWDAYERENYAWHHEWVENEDGTWSHEVSWIPRSEHEAKIAEVKAIREKSRAEWEAEAKAYREKERAELVARYGPEVVEQLDALSEKWEAEAKARGVQTTEQLEARIAERDPARWEELKAQKPGEKPQFSYDGPTTGAATEEEFAKMESDFNEAYSEYEKELAAYEEAEREYYDKLYIETFWYDYDIEAVQKLIAEVSTSISEADLELDTDQWAKRQVLASGIAERIRFVADTERWHVWSGHAWADDRTQRAKYLVEQFLLRASKFLVERANAAASKKEARPFRDAAKKLHAKAAIDRILSLLEHQPEIAVASSDLDADDWILNTPGGIVDLRTGKLRPSDPSVLCSKSTAVAPVPGRPEKFSRYLEETTQGDRDLQQFLQKLLGYALTGSTREQTLDFVHGPGKSGKSVFLDTMRRIFGGYAVTSAMNAFVASRNEQHPTSIAKLAGARLVTAAETEEGRRWDSQKLKELTGGDMISARFMRQDEFEFKPKFKLLIVGNDAPRIGGIDDALRRRIHIVPFMRVVPEEERNLDLADELFDEEAPQILQWLIDGCLIYQKEGLRPPEVVLAHTEEYFEEEDDIGRWLEERCEFDPSFEALSSDLFADWKLWANTQNLFEGTQTLLARRLKKRNDPRFTYSENVTVNKRRGRGFKGVRPKNRF